MNRLSAPNRWAGLTVLLASGAATLACGVPEIPEIPGLENLPQTAEAIGTEAAVALPTLQYELTRLSEQVTENAPIYYGTMTAIVATARASGNSGLEETVEAGATEFVATPTPDASLPVYGTFDGLETTHVARFSIGQAQSSRINTVFEAHNWLVDLEAGQTVTINISALDGGDFRAVLLDPTGTTLTTEDDTVGLDPSITWTAAEAGAYTIRIDAWTPGAYTINASNG